MKKINNIQQLVIDESYLIFVGYDHSPSGFDIGTFNLAGNFEMQGSGSVIPFTDQLQAFKLPEVLNDNDHQQPTTNGTAERI